MTTQVTVAFVSASEEETPADVCWHNLLFADRVHHLEFFAVSAHGWVKHTASDYQQLERRLREHNCDTQVIAVPGNGRYALPWNARACGHWMLYSCRPRQHALEEMLQYCESYDENFARLADAGDIVMTAPRGTPTPYNPEMPTLFSVLCAGRHKLALAV